MLAVLSQQKLYPMNRRHGYVKCVDTSLGRYLKLHRNGVRELLDRLIHVEYGNVFQVKPPLICCSWIPLVSFVKYELRNKDVEIWSMVIPPFTRRQLVCRNTNISAAPHCQVTNDGCLKIGRSFHSVPTFFCRNAPVHRAAANDVDFRTRVARRSGACMPDMGVSLWGASF